MLDIEAPTLKNLLLGQDNKTLSEIETARLQSRLPFVIRHRNKINPFNVFCVSILLSLFLSLFHIKILAVTIGLSLYLYAVHKRTQKTAQNLEVVRKVKNDRLIEGDPVQVDVKIYNYNQSHITHFLFKDSFHGCHNGNEVLFFDQGIPPGTMTTVKYEKICDAGMGEHEFGELKISISDILGIFKFNVTLNNSQKVYVAPKIIPIDDLAYDITNYNGDFGRHESTSRGYDINFQGVRPYVRGDSLRFISWKLTAKTQELYVKTFEKNVNLIVTFMGEFHADLHVGYKSASSWEYSKDLLLSLMSQLTYGRDKMQIITNEFTVPFGSGDDHLFFVGQKLAKMNIYEQENTNSTTPLIIGKYKHQIPQGSELCYVTPYNHNFDDEIYDSLTYLKSNNIEVKCVLIDIERVLQKIPREIKKSLTSAHFKVNYKKRLKDFSKRLEYKDIEVFVGDYSDEYWNSLNSTRSVDLEK